METIALIHFQPLERYPPITNIISELAKSNHKGIRILVLTNEGKAGHKKFPAICQHITISRLSQVSPGKPRIVRLWNYLKFYTRAVRTLWTVQPKKVVYFETLSAFPALLYHSFFRSTKLAAHFHEYSSPIIYRKGMWLERQCHKFEKLKYRHYEWVSQTNQYRLNLFLKDHPAIRSEVARILPNYPPKDWTDRHSARKNEKPVRVVYIGAFSKESMYLEEFTNWICTHEGEVTLDIFSNNFKQSAVELIEKLNSPFITFRGDTDYHEIPNILQEYQVGVILYKGESENHVYSVPNKLFEYHSCGLDVWIPNSILGSLPYATQGTYPKITALDFKSLKKIDLHKLVSRDDLAYKPNSLNAEKGIEEFQAFLLN